MVNKQELINTIDPNKNYLGTYIVARVKELEVDTYKPSILRKGDVISFHVGNKPRPCVVIKVLKDSVIAIPLTTEEGEYNLLKYENNRFFKEGYFCKQFVLIKLDTAFSRYVGVFDDNKTLNKAIIELRKYINENI